MGGGVGGDHTGPTSHLKSSQDAVRVKDEGRCKDEGNEPPPSSRDLCACVPPNLLIRLNTKDPILYKKNMIEETTSKLLYLFCIQTQ